MKTFLPALRVAIARELHSDYSMDQVSIAGHMGVTQAAVSKYLSGAMKGGVARLSNDDKIVASAKKIARSIAVERVSKPSLVTSVCQSCMDFRNADCVFNSVGPEGSPHQPRLAQ
ncbi:hypothetical protein HY095_05060 [Candidatus Micrarchaeota archaeon]|nr:hypothetical protein [Candidatus Micrarchaeota archaeon]